MSEPSAKFPGRARFLAALAVPALLAGCATAPAPPPQLRPADTAAIDLDTDGVSVYGLYLAGETALDHGQSKAAAFYLAQASDRSPDTAFIKERAFAAALISGEVDRAAALAPPLVPGASAMADGSVGVLGLLTRATVDIAEDRGQEAYALLASAPEGGGHAAAVTLLTPWAAAEAGDWKAATAPTPAGGERALTAFADLGRALLLERQGRKAEAEAIYRSRASGGGVFALAYGAFLERAGRRSDAVTLYDSTLAKAPSDPTFLAARARAIAGRPAPPPPTLKQGAAQALLGPAALMLAAKQGDTGLAYLRLALRLDPDLGEARVLVGDAMDAGGDTAAAREAYSRVKPDSPEYATAQDRLALSLQEGGDKDAALKLARATAAAAPDDPQTLLVLADILRDDERYDEAVQVLDRLMAKMGGDTAASWRLYYMRGASLERAGRWDAAQADLEQALKLKPDDPEILNYLGFAWADRGEHLHQALGLLQKATALEPQSGAIIDSLGWVHFRLGQYPQAVRELELAVSLDPADPEVNAHLGDAYWKTGRHLEADYQWRRVLTLDPDAVMRAGIQARLADGLQTSAASRTPEP